MTSVSNESAHLPAWVRRRDGGQVPFEADRICQSLYAAAETLGTASAFLIRELTDVVLHFLAQADFDAIPTTMQIAEEVEKIVREVGQPQLARRYADMQAQSPSVGASVCKDISIACTAPVDQFMQECLEAYSLTRIFSPDVGAALREGLLRFRLGVAAAPTSLASLVLDTPRLAELPWWLALDDWRGAGGETWIVESPEWLCNAQTHPALTPHLCERLLSLPMVADRAVELHLNIAEAPAWSLARAVSPLFSSIEDDYLSRDRAVFLDSLLERWKTLQAPRIPALAWHLNAESFHDESQRRQLQSLLRLALQGRPIRFVFDRPRSPIALAEGLDRKSPGVLLEVGLDLPRFAHRADIDFDGAVLLKKLPSLARIAVSAAAQKRTYLRNLHDAPLKRGFLIERAPCMVRPIGLDEVVRAVTRADLARSPLSLDFALQILHTLKSTLTAAGRAINLELRVDSPHLCGAGDATMPPRQQLECAGKLHARAGAGTATLLLPAEPDFDADGLTDLLRWAWESTAVVRLQLQRAEPTLLQGELPI